MKNVVADTDMRQSISEIDSQEQQDE